MRLGKASGRHEPEIRKGSTGMRQNVYGYARVSTKDQNEDRQIVAMLEEGIPRKSIYIDKMSGKDFERPMYKRLKRRLKEGDVLYIKSLDRLGRNYEELQEQWRIITKDMKVDVVVLDMPILDTRQAKGLLGTLISDLVLALLSYVSENERTEIRQRQAEGIAAAKERGVRFGRPPIPVPDNFEDICQRWRSGELTMKNAADVCGLKPQTFYSKAIKCERLGEWFQNESVDQSRI